MRFRGTRSSTRKFLRYTWDWKAKAFTNLFPRWHLLDRRTPPWRARKSRGSWPAPSCLLVIQEDRGLTLTTTSDAYPLHHHRTLARNAGNARVTALFRRVHPTTCVCVCIRCASSDATTEFRASKFAPTRSREYRLPLDFRSQISRSVAK
jgi:hypothetical protein